MECGLIWCGLVVSFLLHPYNGKHRIGKRHPPTSSNILATELRLTRPMKNPVHPSEIERKRGRLVRAITRPPFNDERGEKGWFTHFSRAPPHVMRHLRVELDGWPNWTRPMRIAFLSDFHTGSHAHDVERLRSIIDEVGALKPDLALFGGDYVNLQLFGGGRVPPQTIATEISRLPAPLGRFAILGNHDYIYGGHEVMKALGNQNIAVLDHEQQSIRFQDWPVDIIGIPDGDVRRPAGYALLRSLTPARPALLLAHDPAWFADMPPGPFLMLAGHTHGGQIRVPGIGILRNGSRAPLRWSHGLTREGGKTLYVTSGIGTSAVPLRWGVPPEVVVLDVAGS